MSPNKSNVPVAYKTFISPSSSDERSSASNGSIVNPQFDFSSSNKASISIASFNTGGVYNIFMSSPTSDERDGGNSESRRNIGQGNGQDSRENLSGSPGGGGDRKPTEHSITPVTYNEEELKNESKRIKTFSKTWPHTFISPKDLAAEGFYYIKDDLVRCAFCKIEVGRWEEGDIPMKEHKRWSGNCPFIRGVSCGNVPIGGYDASCSSNKNDGLSVDNSTPSYDTCGIHEEMRPFSFCDNETPIASTSNSNLVCVKSKYVGSDFGGEEREPTKPSLEKLGVRDMHAPVHPEYCTEAARLATYSLWPLAIKQRPNTLSEAGFYYTGNGDQTICFHCGGGLRDWEEGDNPWIEHAKWFSRCHFLNLVKGSDFVSQVTETRPALITAEEVRGLVNSYPAHPGQVTASITVPGECETNIKSSSSSTKTTEIETEEKKSVETKEVKDEARLCKICYSAELGVVFLPCGHMVACVRCAPSMSICPVCRQPFSHTVRAFIS